MHIATFLRRFRKLTPESRPVAWLIARNAIHTPEATYGFSPDMPGTLPWLDALQEAAARAKPAELPLELLLDPSVAPVLITDRTGSSAQAAEACKQLFDDIFDANLADTDEPSPRFVVRSIPISPRQALACAIPQGLYEALVRWSSAAPRQHIRARPAVCAAYDPSPAKTLAGVPVGAPCGRIIATDESLIWLTESAAQITLYGPAGRTPAALSRALASFPTGLALKLLTVTDLAVSDAAPDLVAPDGPATGLPPGQPIHIVHRRTRRTDRLQEAVT